MKRVLTASLAATLAWCLPGAASAFCGFYVGGAESSLYNDATMVVMMRDGTRTVLSMQNSYQGPVERFAMVVPVPTVLSEDDVRTLPTAVFERIDHLAAPRLVEYWEQDPCAPPRPTESRSSRRIPRRPMMLSERSGSSARLGVTVEAEFAVAEYEIVILSAQDSAGLDTWLRQEGYHIPAGAEVALRPYVAQGTKFFVARVDPSRVTFENGRAMLSPLRVAYDSDTFSLPVRLGQINSQGTQDLIVHVLARNQRYEVANYANVNIPTNLEVRPRARGEFGTFYAALFDKTIETHPGSVVTEYAWQAGSCDPCPGPTLTPQDIMTLGADVVGGAAAPQVGPGGGFPGRGRSRGFMGGANQWTLTRLHYRYGRGALGEDLVFRAAAPLVGGRGAPNRAGRMDPAVHTGGGLNNFQGRYAVLHRWRGALTCEHPVRGIWGGPPNGQDPGARPALDLATQPRAGVRLTRYLRRPVPALRRRRSPRGGGAPGAEPSAPRAAITPPAPARAALAGCRAAPAAGSGLALGLIGLGLLAFVVRRRR